MRIFAHRGASAEAPENTLAAFLRAVEQEADGIELDVRLTADRQLLVVHDPIPVGACRADYPEQPTLSDVFAAVGERLGCLNVELKEEGNGLEERVVECIVEQGLTDRVLLSSFLPAALHTCRALAPALPCARLFARTVPEDADEWPVLHPHFALVTEATLALWREAGKQVNVWTVNDPTELRRLAALGVDGLITDLPALARATLFPPSL